MRKSCDYTNTWQGPYIGVEFLQKIHKKIVLDFFYKLNIANVFSSIRIDAPDHSRLNSVLILAEASSHSTVKAVALGNYVQIGANFLGENWRIGTHFGYLRLNNRKNATIYLGAINRNAYDEALLGATLIQIIWQQLMYTLSFDIQF